MMQRVAGRGRLIGFLASAAALLLVQAEAGPAAAEAAPPPALVAAAKAEGSFKLYASVSEGEIKALLAGFEQRYGIHGSYLRLVSTPLIQRFITEEKGGVHPADVFLDSSPTAFARYPDAFAALTPAVVPGLASWPRKWVADRDITVSTSAMVVQYDTNKVAAADVPKTWQDVVDPKWKGHIVLTDPRGSNTYLGWLDAVEMRYGADFVRKLGQQDFKLTHSGAAGAQMVAAGAFSLSFPAYASFSVPLIKRHAPIASRVIADPEVVNQTSIAVVADATHLNAARLFVSWLISSEGLRTLCSHFPVSSPGDLGGKLGCVPLHDPELVNYAVTPARKQALLKELGLSN